jgi:small-conductance mechanosensitive channel
MTTRFNRKDNGTFVQLPHNLLNTLWIENYTRSKQLKEFFTIAVNPDTTFQQVEEIQQDLQGFVKRNERDFVDASSAVTLSSITDLTQLKLDIEVEHKVRNITRYWIKTDSYSLNTLMMMYIQTVKRTSKRLYLLSFGNVELWLQALIPFQWVILADLYSI